MRVAVLTVGKGGNAWADAAVADYGKRIRHHLRLDEAFVKAERYRGDEAAVRAAEASRLRASLTERDRLVVLDERGEDLDTAGFTALVRDCQVGGAHRLVFAIGGPYGHDPALRASAWRTIRLSSLVLNHELARIVLYEQIYRALTLLAGHPYHH